MGRRKSRKRSKGKEIKDKICRKGCCGMKLVVGIPGFFLFYYLLSNWAGFDLLSQSYESSIGSSKEPLRFTLHPIILNTYFHNPMDFTQGFEFYKNRLYESDGLYRKSHLHIDDHQKLFVGEGEVDGEETLLTYKSYSKRTKDNYDLRPQLFGEGLTIFRDKLYVLTWKENVILVFDLLDDGKSLKKSFEKELSLPEGPSEGWGLTHDDKNLILSDGSANLFWMDPTTMKVTKTLQVEQWVGTKEHGHYKKINNLNELENIDGLIWANIWFEKRIIVIDPISGKVLHEIDFSDHIPAMVRRNSNAVLNGIAYNPETKTVFITGKLWPVTYEIQNPKFRALKILS